MIRVIARRRINLGTNMGMAYYIFECPICKEEVTFIGVTPYACRRCSHILPMVEKLLFEKETRVLWHLDRRVI